MSIAIASLVGGPSVLLNLILVDAGVRPSMLFQPCNFGEWLPTDPITSDCLQYIKKYFPHLVYSETYTHFQGIIISKEGNYTGATDINSTELGKILGYPCYNDFDLIRDDLTDKPFPDIPNVYTIELAASIEAETYTKIQLFANISIGNSSVATFQEIAKKAQIAFNNPKYAGLLGEISVKTVDVISNKSITIANIIDALVALDPICPEMLGEIENYMWNMGDSNGSSDRIIKTLHNSDNKIHSGILVYIMIDCMEKSNRERPIYGRNSYELTRNGELRDRWFEAIEWLFQYTNPVAEFISTYTIDDPLKQLMSTLIYKRTLTAEDKCNMYSRLLTVSEDTPEVAALIISKFDPSNELHIGIMAALLVGTDPNYDTTEPIRNLDSNSYKYKAFKQLCRMWIGEVYYRMVETSK